MSRYIDADKLKSEFDFKHIDMNKTAAVIHHCNILEIINRQPTADVRENIKAQKVIGGGEHDGATCWFECSHCHGSVDIEDAYCKHCGAVLERGQKNEQLQIRRHDRHSA